MVNDQLALYPAGLTRKQFNQLMALTKNSTLCAPDELLAAAERHLQEAIVAHQRNRLINLRLATAIYGTIQTVISNWDELSAETRPWVAAAILYFSHSNDDEPDLLSSIGFEDDAEILNACLKFAQRADLCIAPEDYDDV